MAEDERDASQNCNSVLEDHGEVKVEVKSEREEQINCVDIEHETYPVPDETKLEVTSDAVKNEMERIYIKEEITENFVTDFPVKNDTQDIDIKPELPLTEELEPIIKTITK
ncbi:hypothetical protein L9F63_000624, partial [Diploptera punctata]